jgi:hypothetical protein
MQEFNIEIRAANVKDLIVVCGLIKNSAAFIIAMSIKSDRYPTTTIF